MKQMTNIKTTDIAEALYDRTVDFINEEVIELLYDYDLIDELSDDAIHLANDVIDNYFNKNLTKNL